MAYTNLSDLFKGICDAIRAKKGKTGNINHQDIPSEIAGILSPSDGSIPTKTSNNLSVSGATVTVPAGYYASNASKSISTGTLSSPSISVSSSGVITATSGVSTSGYLSTSASKSNTKSLTTQAAKTITPSTSSQTAVTSGVYTTGAIKVAAIPSNYVIPNGTRYVTENGTHNVKNEEYVNVNVEASPRIEMLSGTPMTINQSSFNFRLTTDTTNLIGFAFASMYNVYASNLGTDEYALYSGFIDVINKDALLTYVKGDGRTTSYATATTGEKINLIITSSYIEIASLPIYVTVDVAKAYYRVMAIYSE